MPDGQELEVKLRLEPRAVARFVSEAPSNTAHGERKQTRTVYYDDRRQTLSRRGLELRVRTSAEGHVQTVKSGAGLSRGEWEGAVAEPWPDLRLLKDTPAGDHLPAEGDLDELFTVDVERQHWHMSHGDTHLDLSVDHGVLDAHGTQEEINEAELELKGGSPAGLFDVARQIVERHDATPSFVGKSLRGQRLAAGQSRSAEHGLTLRLHRKASVAEVFAAIVTACLRQISLNEELLRSADDPEALHQMRVGLRRLRAAFSLFGRAIGEPPEAIRRDLKWMSDRLGAARDLDAFVAGPLAHSRTSHPGLSALAALADRCEFRRTDEHNALQVALRSPRYRQLLLAVVEFAHLGAWRTSTDAQIARRREMRFTRFARQELDRRFRAIAKHAEKITGDDPVQRHHVRIKAKKLRYMADFLRPLAPPKAFERTSKQFKKLQDVLGGMQDAVAADQLLAGLLQGETDDAMTLAASLVRQDVTTTAARKSDAKRTHRKFAKSRPFWQAL